MFYSAVILVDSIYRKDEKLYNNDYIEIYFDVEYSDDSDGPNEKVRNVKCIDLYLRKQKNWSAVIPKCRSTFLEGYKKFLFFGFWKLLPEI